MTRARPHDVRHFAVGDDAGSPAPDNTPAPRAPVAQPRRDAQTHFELRDDGERSGPRRAGPPRGQGAAAARAHNERHDENTEPGRTTAAGLAHRHKNLDPQFEMADVPAAAGTPPGQGQGKGHARGASRHDLAPHFQMTDESPAGAGAGGGLGERSQSRMNRGLGDNRSPAAKAMGAQWAATDASPVGGGGAGRKGKENMGIKTDGDGMGGKKGQARGWAFGDEEEVAPEKRTMIGGRRTGQGSQKTEGIWDF